MKLKRRFSPCTPKYISKAGYFYFSGGLTTKKYRQYYILTGPLALIGHESPGGVGGGTDRHFPTAVCEEKNGRALTLLLPASPSPPPPRLPLPKSNRDTLPKVATPPSRPAPRDVYRMVTFFLFNLRVLIGLGNGRSSPLKWRRQPPANSSRREPKAPPPLHPRGREAEFLRNLFSYLRESTCCAVRLPYHAVFALLILLVGSR